MIHQYKALRIFALASVLLATNTPCFADETVPELGQLEFPGHSLVLPLTDRSGHPKVIVDMGDGVQNEFVVDTGASVNVLDSAIAQSLGLEIVGEMQIGAPGGPQIPGKIVRAPVAHVGSAKIENAEFVTMDLDKFSAGSLQGVLSMGLFRDYLLTYDYRKNEIRVTRETLALEEPGVMSYNDVSGHIQIDMEVAGTILATHLDTGSMAGFTLPIDLKASLPLKPSVKGSTNARLVGGNRDIQFGQLDGDIVFAGTRFEEPNVGFMDPSPGYGNVGNRVLSDFVVSVDQKNHLIRFQKSPQEAVANANKAPRRLGVQFRGMPGGGALTVAHVEPNSLGELSGLRPGDVLLRLNDKPSEEYDMAALGALFGSEKTLQIEVGREGQTHTIEIN